MGRLVRTEVGAFVEPLVPVPAIATPQVMPPAGFGVRVDGAEFDVENRKENAGRVEVFATSDGRWVREVSDLQAPSRV